MESNLSIQNQEIPDVSRGVVILVLRFTYLIIMRRYDELNDLEASDDELKAVAYTAVSIVSVVVAFIGAIVYFVW